MRKRERFRCTRWWPRRGRKRPSRDARLQKGMKRPFKDGRLRKGRKRPLEDAEEDYAEPNKWAFSIVMRS